MPHDITDISLQKAATHAGCDIPADTAALAGWSLHRSCRFSLSIWIRIIKQGVVVALSKDDVLAKLLQENPNLIIATIAEAELPVEAAGAVVVEDNDILYIVLARIVQLELSLPHRLAEAFIAETAALPLKTEAERLVVQRIGQDKLRTGLLEYWGGKCAVTELALPAVLRASHIKPWSKCSNDGERLNIYNALLLAPHLDVLFDGGFISFNDEGTILLSPHLTSAHCDKLTINKQLKITRVVEANFPFLQYHRDHILKK